MPETRIRAAWLPIIFLSALVLVGWTAATRAQPLAQAAQFDREVTVASAVATDSLAGTAAPLGWVYLLVELAIRNTGAIPIEGFIVADVTRILEDETFPYLPEAPAETAGDALWSAADLAPGAVVGGVLAFLVPAARGPLQLTHETPGGMIVLALEPPETAEPEAELAATPSLPASISAAEGASLELTRTVYGPWWEIVVTLRAPPGLPNDAWVGIVPSDVPHGDEATNDQHDVGYAYVSGITEGTLRLTAPATPGDYDLRLNEGDDGGRELASVSFRVVEAPPGPVAGMPDIVPTAPVNVAPSAFGTTASGGYSDSTWALIDGDLATSRYFAYGPLEREAPMTIAFDRVYRIERFVLHLYQPDARYYRYLLEASLDGEDWFLITDRTEGRHRGVQDLPIIPREMKYVRIVVLEQTGASQMTLVELEAFTRDPVPLNGAARSVHDGVFSTRDNVAFDAYGGHIVDAIPGAALDMGQANLIDGNYDAPGWIADTPLGGHQVTIGFRDDRATVIDGVAFRGLSESYALRLPEVAVIEARTPAGAWVDVGRYGLFQYANWQRVGFDPIEADRVRITFYGNRKEGTNIGLAEIAVFEAAGDRNRSILAHNHGEGGLNIAHVANGGRIEWAHDTEEGFEPERLIDGGIDDWGWYSGEGEYPKEVVISFRDGRTALVGGVALNPYAGYNTFRGRYSGVKRFEVLVSETGPTEGFQSVGVFHLDMRWDYQVFQFPPLRARYVKVRVLDNHSQGRISLGEVEVLEAVEPDTESILANRELNLADRRLGGHAVFPTGNGLEALIAGAPQEEGGWWVEGEPPFDLVFGFYRHKAARIDRVIVSQHPKSEPPDQVRRVKVYVSTDSPTTGFRAVGDYELAPGVGDQTLSFPETEARYVRLRVLGNGGGRYYGLASVAIPEVLHPGTRSILNRYPDEPVLPARLTREQALEGDDAEAEPNGELAAATPVALDRSMVGRVDPPDDVDWYRIDTTGAEQAGLNFRIEEVPILRVGLELYDEAGTRIDEAPLYEGRDARAAFTWHVPQGVYHLRVYRPLTSIVALADLSGSTDGVRGEITRGLHAFVSQITPYERVSILGFCSHLVPVAEFSNSREELEEAAYGVYGGCNGTGLYSAVIEETNALVERPGMKVLFLITDGEDSGNHMDLLRDLWDLVLPSGVRIYGLGYGGGLVSRLGGFNGDELLRSWSDATGGRYFRAPSSEDIEAVTRFIGEELREVSRYRLTATVPRGAGTVRVLEVGESVAGVAAPSQIALILDASGSMRGRTQDQVRKMTVAKDVMRAMIASLPAQTQVGLRVYGHRRPREPKAESCQDTELVVPFGPLDRDRLTAAVDAIKPQGQTPIGLSLQQLREDFGDTPGHKVVILLTDGIETCDPDPTSPNYPPDVVRALLAEGFDIKVNVVGFDIGESATRDFLTQVASLGGGQYFDADNADELQSALESAMRAGFEVTDSRRAVVAGASVGDPPLEIPEGAYTVILDAVPPVVIADVWVQPDMETRIILDKEGSKVGVAQEIVAPDTPLPVGARVLASGPPAPAAEVQLAAEAEDGAPVSGDLAGRIAALLAEAEALFRAQKLTTPVGGAALDRYRKVLGLDPGNTAALAGIAGIVEAYVGWGDAALARGDAAKAARNYRKAIAITGDDSGLYVRLGNAERAARSWPEAEAAYLKALKIDAANVEALQGLDAVRAAALTGPSTAPTPAPSTTPASPVVEGVPTVLDTSTLMVGGQLVPLLGVLGEVGPGADGLRSYLGGRVVFCTPMGAGGYRCQVDGFDVAEAIVFNGGARATADAPAHLLTAEASARANRRGIWQ